MISPTRELKSFFRAALVDVPDEGPSVAQGRGQTRRRVLVTVTLLVGAVGLGGALLVSPGDPLFYFVLLGIALVWIAGALASGPIHLGHARTRDGRTSRAVLQGFILGGLLLGVFLAGATVVAQVPFLRTPVDNLLDHAQYGSLGLVIVMTALNGIAEEFFFRGALFAALPRPWRLRGSVLLYALSSVLAGIPLLTFAALCLGVLTGLQRRVTGGVLGPITSHVTWSVGMLILLPIILGTTPGR